MENTWNKKNTLKQLLYMLLYFAACLLVCVLGSVHPILFVCYQITAGILLTGVLVKGFDQIQAPGVALSFGAILLFVFFSSETLLPGTRFRSLSSQFLQKQRVSSWATTSGRRSSPRA